MKTTLRRAYRFKLRGLDFARPSIRNPRFKIYFKTNLPNALEWSIYALELDALHGQENKSKRPLKIVWLHGKSRL